MGLYFKFCSWPKNLNTGTERIRANLAIHSISEDWRAEQDNKHIVLGVALVLT